VRATAQGDVAIVGNESKLNSVRYTSQCVVDMRLAIRKPVAKQMKAIKRAWAKGASSEHKDIASKIADGSVGMDQLNQEQYNDLLTTTLRKHSEAISERIAKVKGRDQEEIDAWLEQTMDALSWDSVTTNRGLYQGRGINEGNYKRNYAAENLVSYLMSAKEFMKKRGSSLRNMPLTYSQQKIETINRHSTELAVHKGTDEYQVIPEYNNKQRVQLEAGSQGDKLLLSDIPNFFTDTQQPTAIIAKPLKQYIHPLDAINATKDQLNLRFDAAKNLINGRMPDLSSLLSSVASGDIDNLNININHSLGRFTNPTADQ